MPVRKNPVSARRDQLLDELHPGRRGLGAWSAFIRAHATLMREMDTRLRDSTGCSLADFDVLSQIAEAGGRLRMTELAERALVSRSGLTRRVAHLEDEGFVKRSAADEDARGVIVCLTEAGVRRMVETQRSHSHHVKDLFITRLGDRDLAVIERVMRNVFVDCNFG